MGKKKAKPEPPKKHALTTARIQSYVQRWQALEAEMAPYVEELKQIKDILLADMDPKDAHEFDGVTLRCIQGKSRGLGVNEWKKIAIGLARKVYPDTQALRDWLRSIARKFPYKPTKPYVRLFDVKETEE